MNSEVKVMSDNFIKSARGGKENKTHDKIELRSEKVRNLLGEKPAGAARWGTAIIVLIFALFIATLLFIEFPYGNGESILRHIFTNL